MTDYEARVKNVEGIVKKGYIRHDEIDPALEKLGLAQISSDDISDLVKTHKYRQTKNVIKGSKAVADKICSYISAILVGIIIAETMAAREFAGSLLAGKLEGFGENFLFWLGIKKIEISGPEMARAMAAVGAATPEIVKGIVIGVIAGYIGWKVASRVVAHLFRRQKRRKDIGILLKKNDLA